MKYFGVGVKVKVEPKVKHKHNGSIYPAKPKIKYEIIMNQKSNKSSRGIIRAFLDTCKIEIGEQEIDYNPLYMCEIITRHFIVESSDIESWKKSLEAVDIKMIYREVK